VDVSRLIRRLGVLLALTVVYLVAGKLGLRLAFVHASVTAVWAPTGISLAAFLTLGYEVWPAVLLAAFLVNLTTAGSVATSIGIAIGNTVEGVVGAYLVTRFAGGRRAFLRAPDALRFALLAAIVATAISATIGVTTLSVGGFAPWRDYGSLWMTWWLGDAVGALVVTPVLLWWIADHRVQWSKQQWLEAAVLLATFVVATLAVFSDLATAGVRNYPLEFVCLPFLIWAAFRFSPREVATAMLILSGIAIAGTMHGFGPFVRESENESLLLLQAFIGVTEVTAMAFAIVVAERHHVEEQLRRLAVSDPLTGLANYRQMTEILQGEIKRCQRTGRRFAVLFLDLDGLKKINDRHGHLVGSRALCRVADAIQAASRVIDTGARYGGDEFALILPETGEAAAAQVATRLTERLSADGEKPKLSASIGIAVYPRDGDTVEVLLGAADGLLYDAKSHVHGRPVRH
jgi:diguanylate cyclase (GGDEF)-like protein